MINQEKVLEVVLLCFQAVALYYIKCANSATNKNRERILQTQDKVDEVRQIIYEAPNCQFKCPMEKRLDQLSNKSDNDDRKSVPNQDCGNKFNYPESIG